MNIFKEMFGEFYTGYDSYKNVTGNVVTFECYDCGYSIEEKGVYDISCSSCDNCGSNNYGTSHEFLIEE